LNKFEPDIIIRAETPNDYLSITQINDAAFGQKNEGLLVENLRKTPAFIPQLSLVAEFRNRLIGHLLFYPIEIKNEQEMFKTLALAPMSVLPEFQKKGIGEKLIRQGLKAAKKLGHKSVIVLGHPEYYPKFGFEPASRWGIKAPFPVEDKYFMAQELSPGALENVHGVVVYHDEFNDV
jgi:predicted N-acetyltransferase YhbS